nr:MAG TPA: hypothetical protein [Caudoviricetes sp.]
MYIYYIPKGVENKEFNESSYFGISSIMRLRRSQLHHLTIDASPISEV